MMIKYFNCSIITIIMIITIIIMTIIILTSLIKVFSKYVINKAFFFFFYILVKFVYHPGKKL